MVDDNTILDTEAETKVPNAVTTLEDAKELRECSKEPSVLLPRLVTDVKLDDRILVEAKVVVDSVSATEEGNEVSKVDARLEDISKICENSREVSALLRELDADSDLPLDA